MYRSFPVGVPLFVCSCVDVPAFAFACEFACIRAESIACAHASAFLTTRVHLYVHRRSPVRACARVWSFTVRVRVR
eukprot:717208-Pleurochrysis_carterae.AAC.6